MKILRALINTSAILLLPLLASCSKSKVDPEFQQIVENFYKEAEARGLNVRKNNLSVYFGETIPGATAQCVLSNARPESGGTEIVVNREGWHSYQNKHPDDYYEPEKEILLFHELGHCLLGREHLEKTIHLCDHTDEETALWFEDVPLSIMKQNNFIEPKIYLKLRQYYLDELFLKTPRPLNQNIFKTKSEAECKRQNSDDFITL